MKYYIGIDPGKLGAMAVIDSNRKVCLLEDWPGDEVSANRLIVQFLYEATKPGEKLQSVNVLAAVESVHAMPKQGVSSMFKFGKNVGMWLGLLAAHKIPVVEPTPQKWQKGLIKKIDGNTTKERSLTVGRRLFPDQIDKLKLKKHNGRTDALLMALWLRNQEEQPF